ncbi:MAG: acyltransferase family protein [Janthinobacterium lividum]
MEKEQARTWVAKFYPSLDGLRGLAILMVFVNHYGAFVFPSLSVEWLWIGVDLFFVLSGFLITGILIDSRDAPNYFRNFYIRRTLRIFPLYYGVFLLIAILTPILRLHCDRVFWLNLLYLENFTVVHPQVHNPTLVYVGPVLGNTTILGFGTIWSLCVEEQFYLTWPLVAWLLPSRRAVMQCCIFGIVVTFALRLGLLLHDPVKAATTHYLHFSPYTRCDSLLVGALLATWLRSVRITRTQLRRIAHLLVTVGLGTVALGMATLGRRWAFNEVNPVYCSYGYTFLAFAAAGTLMLALDETSAFSRLLRHRELSGLGKISYGFYILHAVFWNGFDHLRLLLKPYHLQFLSVLLAFGSTYCLARLSYKYLESPFLALKDRWAPTTHAGHPTPTVIRTPS